VRQHHEYMLRFHSNLLKPKIHYTKHCVACIRSFGRNLSCFAPERKHKDLVARFCFRPTFVNRAVRHKTVLEGSSRAQEADQTPHVVDARLANDQRRRTPGFLIYVFLTDRKSSILGVWAAPGGRETLQKGWGLRPHLFGGFPGRPGPPRPPKSTISGRSNKHIFKTQVYVGFIGLWISGPD